MPLQCMQAMYWPGDGVGSENPPEPTPSSYSSMAAVFASTGFTLLLVAAGALNFASWLSSVRG